MNLSNLTSQNIVPFMIQKNKISTDEACLYQTNIKFIVQDGWQVKCRDKKQMCPSTKKYSLDFTSIVIKM